MVTLCHVFGVHRSSYRYWKNRPEKPDCRRAVLRSQVLELHGISHGSAGARSIATMATRRGYQMGRWLAGRLMKELGLVSCQQPTHRYKRSGHEHVAIPKSPTDRIKNDHRDAISLARLLRAGELTPVWIPDLTHEAMRDLIRARAAAKRDSRVARQRILSMLLRTDKHYAGKHWTGKHRTWLANQSFSQPSQQIAFQHYCQSLEQIEDRILQLDQEISRLLPEWSLCNLVCQLQALKGVGQLIAITLVAELGDFSRFSNPKQLMAFLGLVPGEYSSGNSIRPRGITKVGNSELRRLLYEAAWSYRTPAKVGAWLIYYRPDSVTQYSKDIAWKAQQRLCSRYRSLTAKGKKSQVAITAVARELTGFMWDIALAAQSSFSQQKQN
ncbi:putative transposase [Escherichia coli 55989]|uniref:Transposase n=3 Tax=Escherichia coli TaxID=562 RepID=B7LFP2_ECO55|nr:putative transposase [Escherichia coli 55989]